MITSHHCFTTFTWLCYQITRTSHHCVLYSCTQSWKSVATSSNMNTGTNNFLPQLNWKMKVTLNLSTCIWIKCWMEWLRTSLAGNYDRFIWYFKDIIQITNGQMSTGSQNAPLANSLLSTCTMLNEHMHNVAMFL